MNKPTVISKSANYTFRDYFGLKAYTKEILAHFGYTFEVQHHVNLPMADVDNDRIHNLQTDLEANLPYLILDSEAARRELLIAPVLLEVVRHTQAELRIEHPLEIDNQLKGTLDYFLQAKEKIVVIEAKQADLLHGFTQLAVELVALDRWLDSDEQSILYGAVSTGDAWRFGLLNRETKHVIQDFRLYQVPSNLNNLIRVLVAILTK